MNYIGCIIYGAAAFYGLQQAFRGAPAFKYDYWLAIVALIIGGVLAAH